MTKSNAVESLVERAAAQKDSGDAMRYSQAACNVANALICASNIKATAGEISPERIREMVNRFLGWRLPENFKPDAGISFKATFNEHMDPPMRHEPYGTNLFDYTQAHAMVCYMLNMEPTV